MGTVILLGISLSLFVGVSHLLARVLLSKKHRLQFAGGYSRTALKLERIYFVFALAFLDILLFATLLMCFWDVITMPLSAS